MKHNGIYGREHNGRGVPGHVRQRQSNASASWPPVADRRRLICLVLIRLQRHSSKRTKRNHLPRYLPEWIFRHPNRVRLDHRHHSYDHHRRWQYAGHHCHSHREIIEEHSELVYCVAGRRRLFPRFGDHAVLVGQRTDGLLDIRECVVRYSFGGRRAVVHCVDYEFVSDLAGSVLEHNEGGGVPAIEDAIAGNGDDHVCVVDVGADLYSAVAGMEGEAER